jgi:hypothetical protein
MYKYTSNSGYKEICRNLIYNYLLIYMLVEVLNAEMLNSEYSFERANFCSNMSDSEINSRNYQVKELLIFFLCLYSF